MHITLRLVLKDLTAVRRIAVEFAFEWLHEVIWTAACSLVVIDGALILVSLWLAHLDPFLWFSAPLSATLLNTSPKGEALGDSRRVSSASPDAGIFSGLGRASVPITAARASRLRIVGLPGMRAPPAFQPDV